MQPLQHSRASACCGLATAALLMLAPRSIADLSLPGPHAAGWRAVTVVRPDNSTFSARLHYPALSAGQNATFDPAGGPYPAISFGHGFVQSVTQYQTTCAHLATHGYFVIASESESGLFPNHQNFASDLRHCLTWLEQQNASSTSPYFMRVDTAAFGLSGHSMGGGASILAAAADSRVRVVAPLAAAETNPSAIAAAATVAAPLFLISGSNDTITPIAGNTQPMYATANPPRQLPVILGGFHCGFTDAGFLFCDSGSITRAQQLTIVRRKLTEIFNLYLRGDDTAWNAVWGPTLSLDPAVATTADSGITLSPATPSATACPGITATIPITITNSGPFAASYTLFAEGTAWPVVFTPQITPVIQGNGGSTSVELAVTPPQGQAAQNATILVSARSDLDGGTRAYSQVLVTRVGARGDLDCDGDCDFFDIDPFILALAGEGAYLAQYPQCDWLNADTDCNGNVDFFDIDPLIGQLGE